MGVDKNIIKIFTAVSKKLNKEKFTRYMTVQNAVTLFSFRFVMSTIPY